MKTYNLNNNNILIITILYAFFFSFKMECSASGCFGNEHCDQDFIDIAKSNTRKALPSFLNCIALSLSSAERLLNKQSHSMLGFTGASFNFTSAILNLYNWYLDKDSIKGFSHHTLNGLSTASSFISSSFSYLSAISSDPKDKNTYSAASSIFGAFGLFCKGLDLFLTTSPIEDYRSRKGLPNPSTYQELK